MTPVAGGSTVAYEGITPLLLNELLMDKRDSDGFFSRRLECRSNNRSYNLTDSSLITVDYQQSSRLSKLGTCMVMLHICILRNGLQLHMHILVVTLDVTDYSF